jgi:hypothetical protein
MTSNSNRSSELTDAQLDQLLEATSEELLDYVKTSANANRTLTAIMATGSTPKTPAQRLSARAAARVRRWVLCWSWRTALRWTLRIAGTAAVLAGVMAGLNFLLSGSSRTLAVFGILFLIVFLAGTMMGVFVIVCWASNREDRQRTLKGTPPDSAWAGTRRLNGVSRKDPTPANTRLPDGAGHEGTERPDRR